MLTPRKGRTMRRYPGHYWLLICFAVCSAASVSAQTGNYSSAAIEQLNMQFRGLYAEARQERLADVSPVVIDTTISQRLTGDRCFPSRNGSGRTW